MTHNNTHNNDAVGVLNGTVENLETLAALVEMWDDLELYETARFTGEDESATELREELVDTLGADHFSALLALKNELGAGNARDVVGEWLGGALDVSVRGMFRGFEWEADTVEVLLTTGGPSVRVIYDGRAALLVSVSWAGPEQTRRVYCAPLSDYLAELCDYHSQVVAR